MSTLPTVYTRDVELLKLAREIATDLFDTETILKNHHIPTEEWERIKRDARFQQILRSELEAWHAASNTHERTKLKAGALIEEWLGEANARLYDKNETLPAKTELVKVLARVAGMGERAVGEGSSGERLTVTINLGSDTKLQFDKIVDVTPQGNSEILPPQES